MNEELQRIKRENRVYQDFLNTAIDFIRTYADRCHHGKEEDILFRDLAKKQISNEHKNIMEELIKEHVYGRSILKKLIDAKNNHTQDNKDAINVIIANMKLLIKFYQKHIEKEDKHFFLPCMNYFDTQEQATMLQEFWDFDKKLIHERYKKTVEQFETKKR